MALIQDLKGRSMDVARLAATRNPKECPELLLDRGPAVAVIISFIEKNTVAVLRGQPASGKTFLAHAVAGAANNRTDLWSQVIVVDEPRKDHGLHETAGGC